MSNKVKDIDIKNRTYYFLNDIIKLKKLNPNNIKIDEMSYKNILIWYVMIKDLKYVKINSLNSLYPIFTKVYGCFEEINKSKYLILVATNETKERT